MSDKMKILPVDRLLNWILKEYKTHGAIFGIPENKFYKQKNKTSAFFNFPIFGYIVETPFGPAAGPHTQLAQNIITAYLTGCRFIELKTVQIMDALDFEKPCIDAFDEGYNTEWSQELSLQDSRSEYVKSWILIHILKDYLKLSDTKDNSGFVFNMSVGYDLKGIRNERMDTFINGLIHGKEEIDKYREILHGQFPEFSSINVPESLSNSATISTMHGCPPDEIESIAKYLIKEKRLNTYVKLNPTLLGKTEVMKILKNNGFDYIRIEEDTFGHDLQYNDAVTLIKNLKELAQKHGKKFGIKLSNTLANKNITKVLPGKERYMSGRALFPITINLALKLASEFGGKLNISFSGGASILNIKEILESGIYPVTIATNILKPGGYMRFYHIAGELENSSSIASVTPLKEEDLKIGKLKELARKSLEDKYYKKEISKREAIKIDSDLGFWDCIIAPCVFNCPIHQDIPEYIDFINKKDYSNALMVILKKNPLPNITGYICDHTCAVKCVRWDYDNPVHIRELKRIAACRGDYEAIIGRIKDEIKSKKVNKKVAVLGSGPAGLASAYFLVREGFDVSIFEKENKPGGTVRYTIPRFRLPDEVIDHDISIIKDLGVIIKTGCSSEFSARKLKREGFDYIIITTGSQKAKDLGLDIHNVKMGFYDSIEFLQRIKNDDLPFIGKRLLIIGGGNSAVDAARAAVRFNPDSVYIVYRRDLENMPADKEEIEACIEEGIEIKELLGPEQLITENGKIKGLKCIKMKLGKTDESGRRRPIPVSGSEVILDADTVISAIGEEVETDILNRNGIVLNNNKTILVDSRTGQTNIPDLYAAGDCVRGPATVVEAIADAKKIISSIIEKERIKKESYLLDSFYNKVPEEKLKEDYAKRGQVCFLNPVEKLPPDKRDNFETVILTLNEQSAVKESERCLQCHQICNKCVETCPNRANIALSFNPVRINIPVFKGSSLDASLKVSGNNGRVYSLKDFVIDQSTQILHVDDFCNECGNCETFCPHSGKPYEDKITLFSEKNTFENSANAGFYLKSYSKDSRCIFGCRINKLLYDLAIDYQKKEISFLSDSLNIVFSLPAVDESLKLINYSFSASDILDMSDMIGMYLITDSLIRHYDYLLI